MVKNSHDYNFICIDKPMLDPIGHTATEQVDHNSEAIFMVKKDECKH